MPDEDTFEVEVTEDAAEAANRLEDLSKEELVAQLRRTRKESAGRRVANREKEAELEEFKKWKESQKTELERLRERAEQAEKTATELKREREQAAVAKAAGLDPEFADRIRGNSKEEMLEDAKKLAEKFSAAPAVKAEIFTGGRGAPVTPTPDNADAFRSWLSNHP